MDPIWCEHAKIYLAFKLTSVSAPAHGDNFAYFGLSLAQRDLLV